MDKVSIVIVNWNSLQPLRRCLDSIKATGYKNLEIIVVNNSQEEIDLPNIVLIQNQHNIGLPKAWNQAIKISTGDYLLVLNPDTRLPKDFFTKSIEFLNTHPDAGTLGPKLVDPDGGVQGSVFPEPSILRTILNTGQKYTPKTIKPITVNSISGSCMFFSKKTVAKIGLFTEHVFMYYEDLDYCRRIRKAGMHVYFNPDLVVVHEHGTSAKQSQKSNPTLMPFWKGYLWDSSLWYNGPIKHYLMVGISLLRQKILKLFTSAV